MKKAVETVGNLTIYADNTFKISNVVLAYPTLIKAKKILDSETPKFTVGALLNKETHAEEIAALRKWIKKQYEETLGKLPSDKVCLRDGSDTAVEALEDYWRLNMSASVNYAPILRIKGEKMSRDDNAEELEEVCVSGAKAAVLGSLYLQDNKYAKRCNCNVIAVNFSGKAIDIKLGGAAPNDDDAWDDDDNDTDDEF